MSSHKQEKHIHWSTMAWLFIIFATFAGYMYYKASGSKVHDDFAPYGMGICFAIIAGFICFAVQQTRVFVRWLQRHLERRRARQEYAASQKREADAPPTPTPISAPPSN